MEGSVPLRITDGAVRPLEGGKQTRSGSEREYEKCDLKERSEGLYEFFTSLGNQDLKVEEFH